MMVQARVSFVAMVNGQMLSVRAHEVLALPPGADWVTAGLAEALAEEPVIETTEAPPPPGVEHAVTRKRKPKAEA